MNVREAFRQAVMHRSDGRCVRCGATAVDAHHVLDRKLFADGGYVVDNGAAVCAACHWDAETTRWAVEDVRRAAGIVEVVVPEGWDPKVVVDKWGHRVWPSGLRSAGPLALDVGMRRALAMGGFLGRLMPADYEERQG